ncbi:hypothetical protein [Pedobacter sp. GR22-6]|uniref:hypothetical protein n=1 Tax=Pedobacter sp. GR22-6 TaxID=3127957 RepID=UPI00307E0673
MFALGLSWHSHAQVAVTLPEANITNRTDYAVVLSTGTYTNTLSLIPNIGVKANSANFASTVGGSTTIPLSLANLRLQSIGSANLLGGSTERSLTTAFQSIYVAVASIGSGAVSINYRINTAPQTWIAGIYRAPMEFRTSTLGGTNLTPVVQNLDITVPSFISPQATLPLLTLNANSLAIFRAAAGVSATSAITVSNTVPYTLNIQTQNPQMSFSTSQPYSQLPNTSVGRVSTTLSGVTGAVNVALSTSSQAITSSTGIAVPASNTQILNNVFSISGTDLSQGFVQAGTYTLRYTLSWTKLSSAYPSTALQVQRSGDLQVVVPDLAEIVANQNTVSLNFNSTAAYQQGISKDMPAHIRVSRTIPYNVYVRATNPNFTFGANTVPVGVMQIGPMAGQLGVNTVTLSTTPQLLVNGSSPVIDRNLNLQYRIPAAQTQQLLGKSPGNYSNTVIYSFVAL